MASRKTLTERQLAAILKVATAVEDPRHAWSETCKALPELNRDVVYRVLSAMEIVTSNDVVLKRNRASVTAWLTASDAKNTTPWKRQRTRKAVTA